MGKARATRHQKFLKSEKSKTKLKAKKDLPKGTNVTKTAFKVKKIVIREHAKPSADEPLSKTKLTLKELLSRLQHFNTTSRNDALNGVKDLVTKHQDEMLSLNVSQLISGVSPLVLDKERSVRRESFKTLHIILSPLSIDKIGPFFDILCSYLRCAMTHIDIRIHEDSLFFFDVLLECAATLIAKNFHKILPSFFDMISKLRTDSQPGRTLSMNLGSKMTSVKWRTKVLLRLLQFFRVLIRSKFELRGINVDPNDNVSLLNFLGTESSIINHKISHCTHEFNKEKTRYFPIYKGIKLAKLNCFSREGSVFGNQNKMNEDKLQSYAQSLMPLLFEAWLEVRPVSSDSKRVESVVSEEGMALLQYILEIITLLWQLLQFNVEDSKNIELTKWFTSTYQNQFTQYFMVAFPYSQSAVKNNKKKNDNETPLGDICLHQNLRICHIFILFNDKMNKAYDLTKINVVLKYVKWSLDQISSKNTECQAQVINIFRAILKRSDWTKSKEMVPLLDTIISIDKENINATFKQSIFEILCSILLNEELLYLQNTRSFQSWLGDLPKMLYEKTNITFKSFEIIVKFAIQNNKLFNQSIRKDLKFIIQNLPNIHILDIENKFESRKKIVGLVYWIKCWDNESLDVLQNQLANGSYDSDVRQHLVDLLKLKSEGLIPM